MAKQKPKAKAAKARAMLGAQLKAQPKKPNPFELKGSKGHFDTMGRRVSGKKQNVIKARQEAVNRVGGGRRCFVHVGDAQRERCWHLSACPVS